MIEPFVAASSAPLFLIVLLALFVFLFILPQRRRQRAQQERLSSVDVGDEVLTVGGLIGRVVETDDSELKVEVADGIVVRIARRSVATVLHPEEEEETYADDDDADEEADEDAHGEAGDEGDEAEPDVTEPEAQADEEERAEPR